MTSGLCQRLVCSSSSADRSACVLPPGKLTVECDEAWSFVNNKGNKQWIGNALDAKTRVIVGVYIGDRSRESALKLWNSLPPLYPRVFRGKLPPETLDVSVQFVTQISGMLIKELSSAKRHKAVGKDSGKTNHIERFNNTMRQRISRLVRKTLSFSKNLENHIRAIWHFIHHYNASLQI